MPASANTFPIRNTTSFSWVNDCEMRSPSGEYFITGREGNLIFAMLMDLNNRVANLESEYTALVAGNTSSNSVTVANTSVLQALTANLSASSNTLANIIKAAQLLSGNNA